ncbi:MAG: hypothetical protein KDC28_12570 [Saprospiraceae bacterium]|nr:hypothetical protein [Saprospiraceae bacterium]MCB9318132.1 hypothetical protein [Lewinellaceae bacterium]
MNKVTLDFPSISQRMKMLAFPEDIDLVIGIGSGGVVPAAMVAHQLGKDLRILWLNFRDPLNAPRYAEPQLLEPFYLSAVPKRHVLLVDDVSVSGHTLETAKRLLASHQVTTMVCKGKADLVLYTDVPQCVNWPWKSNGSRIASTPEKAT